MARMQWEEKCDIPRKVNYCLCAHVLYVRSWLKGCNQGLKEKEVWLFWCFPSANAPRCFCNAIPTNTKIVSPTWQTVSKIQTSSVLFSLVMKQCTRSFVFSPPLLCRDETGVMSSIRILHQDWHNNSLRVYFPLKVTVSTRRLEDGRERRPKTVFMHTWKKPAGADTGEPRDKHCVKAKMICYLDLNRGNVTPWNADRWGSFLSRLLVEHLVMGQKRGERWSQCRLAADLGDVFILFIYLFILSGAKLKHLFFTPNRNQCAA